MRFSFTDEQEMLSDTVRGLFADKCKPESIRATWADSANPANPASPATSAAPAISVTPSGWGEEPGGGRIPGLWAALGELGALGVMAPESVGGLGMDEVDLVRLAEEAGYAAMPEPFVEHAGVAVPALVEGGADELAAAAAAGEITCTIGLEAGGPYVLGAELADVLVMERAGVMYAVTTAAATLTPQPAVDQSRRLSVVEFETADATPLTGADPALTADRATLFAAAQCVGVARRLLDSTVEYVGERNQFGKPVGSYQAVKHHLADVRIAFEFAAPLVYRAAWSVANLQAGSGPESDRQRDVSMAKVMASDAVDRACRAALQCHGAIGYTLEYDLQLWLKRGWALSAAWGDAAYHRDRVATALEI